MKQGTSANGEIWAYCKPVDMRKSFEALGALVREQMSKNPLSGAKFIFTNRRRKVAKVLYFDGSGICLLIKRLEKARFPELWRWTAHETLGLKRSELALFLEGSSLVGRFAVSEPLLGQKDLEVVDKRV